MTGTLAATALLTDGLDTCLTASTRPHFGWQLHTAEGSDPSACYQSAYQVRLSDAARNVLWDSGVVASRRQHFVAYGGADLAADADHHWTVRVHDTYGRPGLWSAQKKFSTGLGTADWSAEWIHRTPGGRAPLELFDGALRMGASPFLPLPCPVIDAFTLDARIRPELGAAGILFRSSGPGTGLLLELGRGELTLRPATAWIMGAGDIPASEPLARASLEASNPADPTPGGWRHLVVHDDGVTVKVSLDGEQLLRAELPPSDSAGGVLALHQRPRSQSAYGSLAVTDGTGEALLDSDFGSPDAPTGPADPLAGWTRTTSHRQADEWTLARTEVRLSGTVVRARLFAAASHQATFHVNGVPCLETSSFGYPGEGYYDAADVTALLQTAAKRLPERRSPEQPAPVNTGPVNTAPVGLAARVHWYGPGQGRAAGIPGLLAQLHIEYDDGRREVFGSGPDWHVAEGPYRQSGYRNDEGDPVEHLDGSAEVKEWEQATSLGRHPAADFPAVLPRRTFLAKKRETAERLLTAADGTIVADFGRVLPARPVVDFRDGTAGRTVMVRAGYSLGPDGRVDRRKTATQNTDMSFPYTQTAGPQYYEAAVHLGFRYLEVPGVEAGELAEVGCVVVHSMNPGEGSFSSSDPTLDAVFTLLRDSALYGVQEQFVDTPTREKGQFLADAVNISYATMALFGERHMTAQALREFAASATRYWHGGNDRGRFNAVYPNGDGKRDIPDFSLMMPEWVEDYHRLSGNTGLVEEVLPCLRATADYVLRHIAADGPTAGLVTELGGGSGPYLHGIVDWPAPGRFGYDMDCAAKTTVNAQAVSVLDTVSRLCSLTGKTSAAARYSEQSAALAAAINISLRVNGVMVDGLHADGTPSTHASQHASSFPLSLGITPAEFVQQDGRRIAEMGMRQGPMTVHRLVRGLLAAGLVDEVLDLLTNAGQPGWAQLLESGASFTWEAWELDEGTDHSQSHAWSASVVREILGHLLGIRVAAAGGTDTTGGEMTGGETTGGETTGAKMAGDEMTGDEMTGAVVIVSPPVCRLEHARGSIPLQRGMVSADWRRTEAGMELDCTVPAGVRATVLLPAGHYEVEGPTPGAALVAEPAAAGGKAVFRIHPGTWRFRQLALATGAGNWRFRPE